MINSDKIINEFRRIKSLGFIKSNRIHDTGIGKTFEDYLGVDENNKKDPDFDNFEVKTQRAIATSFISLYTKAPTHPKGGTRLLKEAFGKPDAVFPNMKVIHTAMFGDRFSYCNGLCRLKISADVILERINLEIKHIVNDTDEMLSNEIY
jgi:MvaI/BcnI restriction endonuclease family